MPTTITGPHDLSRLLGELMPGSGWEVTCYEDPLTMRWVLEMEVKLHFRSAFQVPPMLDENEVYRFARLTAEALEKMAADIFTRTETVLLCAQCQTVIRRPAYQMMTDGEPLCKACYLKEIAP